jgi:hypothetical protein
LTRGEKLLVWGSSGAVAVTGFAYAALKYLLRPADPFAVVNHPLQPVMLKLHVLVAPLFVFAIGTIAFRHIWPHFRARVQRGRRSGITTALVLLPMVASGYLIQTVTHMGWLRALMIVHLVTGAVFAVAAAAHRLRGQAQRGNGRTGADRRPTEPTGTPASPPLR